MYKSNHNSSNAGNSRAFYYLNVPFAEKDQVKRLGGRYDSTKKKWYVPHRMDIFPFLKWMPMGNPVTNEFDCKNRPTIRIKKLIEN